MTQEAMNRKPAPGNAARVLFGLVAAVSVPFWAAAIGLGWDAFHLPEKSGRLAWVQTWEAAVFALGLAAGIVGAAVALGSERRRQSGTGIALVLLGATCVSLSFVMGWYAEKLAVGLNATTAWFILPAILMFASLVTLIESLKIVEKRIEEPSETIEELPQPLFPL